jgi:hypothetical protein
VIHNIFVARDGNYTQGKKQQSLSGETTSQMRTITYQDEAAPRAGVINL